MRKVRYAVAASLDGFIADDNGGADWIVHDPDVDFAELFEQFDTFLIGRHTWEMMAKTGRGEVPGKTVVVFSRMLRPEDHPDVRIVAEDAGGFVKALREQPGADIWLFGGGSLFSSLMVLGQVDTVEVAIVPVLLGSGIPLLPGPAMQASLKLTGHRLYPKTGIMSLRYDVVRHE
jgi:dihydrofolate reductase